jgi:ubiquinone/menaquinone biosynthesis C-methylase UbiE
MSDTKGYVDVDYLTLAAELLRPAKEKSYARLHLQPGQRVLDVGCGPATDTITLAHLLGPEGRVVGVDADARMVLTANERAQATGVQNQVTHRVGDALALPFELDQFDATRCERLFEHLIHPEQALAEMVRVTRPGGRVVVLDTDWATLSFDSPHTDLERRLVRVLAEHYMHNGYSGRRLYRQFKQQGLQEISVELIPILITHYGLGRRIFLLDDVETEAVRLGLATNEECADWRADLENADTEAAFYASVGMVLAAGQKTD